MDALSHWTFWAIGALLLGTIYVQFVGNQIEMLSGNERARNLNFYRSLFGGAPWVQWFMFRYGGIVQIGCGISFFIFFGWRIGVMVVVAVVVFCMLVWRIARKHAIQMLADLTERLEEQD